MKKRMLCVLLALLLLQSSVSAAAACPTAVAPAVALTFDDGPNGACTRALLTLLADQQIAATFFLCGYRVREMPELVAQIKAGGHEIGLHGDSHDYFTAMTPQKLRAELRQSAQAICDAGGGETTLLRPPGGLMNDMVTAQSQQAGLSIILWNVDPEDWRGGAPEKIAAHLIEQASPGSILLMHDLCGTSVTAAAQVIDVLRARGYQFLTVSQLAAHYGQRLEPGHRYHAF